MDEVLKKKFFHYKFQVRMPSVNFTFFSIYTSTSCGVYRVKRKFVIPATRKTEITAICCIVGPDSIQYLSVACQVKRRGQCINAVKLLI